MLDFATVHGIQSGRKVEMKFEILRATTTSIATATTTATTVDNLTSCMDCRIDKPSGMNHVVENKSADNYQVTRHQMRGPMCEPTCLRLDNDVRWQRLFYCCKPCFKLSLSSIQKWRL
eukprot:TRINITY_DN3114_c0_g3_i2.p1 TRINITY_DN3114_c0_g3~~TRINITY_DN3114_c0_g3_i2.p1  ORF type:complete len:118 (-),score=3.55 TRINITY_DN3114_c0_g3_i2:75-428(-)